MANSREVVLMLDATRITGGPHTLVCALTRADLPDEMFDPLSADRSAGADVRFFTSGGAELPRHYQAGSFVLDSSSGSGDGKAVYFVRIPSLINTDPAPSIKVQYGDRGLIDYDFADAYGRNATWTDYANVWGPSGLDDYTGNNENLTINGSVTQDQIDIFDSTNAVSLGGSSSLRDTSWTKIPDGFLVESYFRKDAGSTQTVWAQGNLSTGTDWDALLIRNGNLLELNRYSADFFQAQGGSISTGQWYHIVAKFQSGSHEAFLNGNRVINNTTSFSASSSINTMDIGGLPRAGSVLGFNGVLSTVKVRKNIPAALSDYSKTLYEVNKGGAWSVGLPALLGGDSGALIEASLDLGLQCFFQDSARVKFQSNLTIGSAAFTQNSAQLKINDVMSLGFGGDVGGGAGARTLASCNLANTHEMAFDAGLVLSDALVLCQRLGLSRISVNLSIAEVLDLGLWAAELLLTGARNAPLEATLRIRAERLIQSIARDGHVCSPKFDNRSLKS